MLAYRHAFHAGNHADVLKHAVLVATLRHLNQKDKPWRAVDTQAGAGAYALNAPQAQKRLEFADGIGRLWQAPGLPPLLADYVAQVRAFNGPGELQAYPGSPRFVRQLMRPGDQLRLYELHPTDHTLLAQAFADDRSVMVHKADGFGGLKSQLPPPSRRGLVLIDPPYEIKTDYAAVVAAVREALARFAEAVVLVWLPQLTLRDAAQLPTRLQAVAHGVAPKGWLHAQLTVGEPDAQGFGLFGSSVFVFNPPHTLKPLLQQALPEAASLLSQGARSSWQVRASQGV